MRRVALLLCTAALLLTAIPSSASAFTPAKRHHFCRYESSNGRAGFSNWEVRETIACAVTKFNVPGGFGTALAIADRESGLYPHAVNRSSGTCGIYQHMPRYWGGRVAAFTAARPRFRSASSCFNARANILVSLWMMSTSGLGPWR